MRETAKTHARIDRYFEAFEAGTLKPELCNKKIQDLNARLEELDAEQRELEGRRKRLALPAIDKEMLSDLVANFEEVMAEGTNPQKKHLLRRLVKKVLVHDRRTVEVWYGVPNTPSIRIPGNLARRRHRGRQSVERLAGVEPGGIAAPMERQNVAERNGLPAVQKPLHRSRGWATLSSSGWQKGNPGSERLCFHNYPNPTDSLDPLSRKGAWT